MRARSVSAGFAAAALLMLGILGWLVSLVPVDDGARDWTGSLNPGGWMAWTFPTALFFWVIAALLLTFTWAAIRFPETPRRGILGIATTRGDRFFVSLILAAFIFLFFVKIGGENPIYPSAAALLVAAAMFRFA